ncbi:MAG: hypothetical protein U9Q03_03475 [Patescibacteria group bacterium]|nr:hypothetical protein [Patescibacteria group bacterium]
MGYIVNPKTDGSGILCAIPQSVAKGVKYPCPQRCRHCFFQGGRSFLEPLHENLPNMPPSEMAKGMTVRFNDGLDSAIDRDVVMEAAELYEDVFLNTSIPHDLAGFGHPVVLTVNPGKMTDRKAHLVDSCPPNLMFVRIRATAWNTELAAQVVEHYTSRGVPVVFTFMAFFDQEGDENGLEDIPEEFRELYSFQKRTTNSYWVASQEVWDMVLAPFADNPLVYTCGPNAKTYPCKHCGNCEKLYLETKKRLDR